MRKSIRNMFLVGQSELSKVARSEAAPGVKNRALITERVAPGQRGRLHHAATEWFAVSADGKAIEAGTVVDLLGRDGLTYTVQPTPLALSKLAA